jgi:hypothetical protein
MKNPKSEIRPAAPKCNEGGNPNPAVAGRNQESENALSPARSKTRQTILAFCILHSAFCLCAQAQFSIDWYTIDGGGGASTGGVYTVSGTIGQPDAGAMSGGSYSLTGGFWALYAVQMPGAPLLTIFLTTTNTAVVSWSSPSSGWNPQQNSVLTSTNWITPPETINDNGTNRFIIVNPPTGNRFYRLHKP